MNRSALRRVQHLARVDAQLGVDRRHEVLGRQHALGRRVTLAVGGADDLAGAGSLGNDLRQQEFRIIIQTLKQERGRRNRAAEQLGISPRTLRYKLAQMRDAGIDLDSELAMA